MTDDELRKLAGSLKPQWLDAFRQINPTNTSFRSRDICGFDWNPQNAGAALTALARRGLVEKTSMTEGAERSTSYKLTPKGLLLREHLERNPA